MSKKLKALVSEKTIVLHYDGQKINVQKKTDSLLFEEVKDLINSGKEKELIEKFIDIKAKMEKFTEGTFTVEEGKVFLKGSTKQIPQVVVDKLVDLEKADEDFLPLIRFWKKLSDNPSKNSREELYGFMVANNISLTDQGDIVVEKGVNQKRGSFPGHLVDGYTGTVDNSVGMIVEMPRNKVDDNKNETCSHGLHVGAPEYVRKWYSQDIIIECTVNPVDVVSVPTDYNDTKMRVCRYQVMGYSDHSRTKPEVFSLEDFIKVPTAAIAARLQKGIETGKNPNASNGQHTDVVVSIPKGKKTTADNKFIKELDGKTAKQVVDYVAEKTGKTITLSLKNKKAVVRKGAELLEIHDSVKQIAAKTKDTISTKARKVEKGAWSLRFVSVGGEKLKAVKLVNTLTGLGLKASKAIIDSKSQIVFSNASKRFVEREAKKMLAEGFNVDAFKGELKVEVKSIELSTMTMPQVREIVKSKFNEKIGSRVPKVEVMKQATQFFKNAGYTVS